MLNHCHFETLLTYEKKLLRGKKGQRGGVRHQELLADRRIQLHKVKW